MLNFFFGFETWRKERIIPMQTLSSCLIGEVSNTITMQLRNHILFQGYRGGPRNYFSGANNKNTDLAVFVRVIVSSINQVRVIVCRRVSVSQKTSGDVSASSALPDPFVQFQLFD